MRDHELLRDVDEGVRRLASLDVSAESQVVVEQVRSALEELRVIQEDLAEHNVELEQLQAQLTTERQRYAELFDLAPDAYFVADEYGKILEANASAARLLALDARSLVGKPFSVFVHPASRRKARHAITTPAQEPLSVDVQCIARSGRSFVGDLRVAVPDGAGPPSKRLCILRDLTPERQAQAESQLLVRELEERGVEQGLLEERLGAEYVERRRLRLLLERLREGVIAFDPTLHVVFANTEAMRIVAPARLEVGHRLPDAWPELSLREVAAGLFAAGAAPFERLIELQATERVLSLVGLPSQGTDLALLVIVDVSGRERRERAEREFVANAAHELRTPLTAITSAVDVLQSGAKESPEARDRFLGHLERETQRLGLLMQALLLLARVQGGAETARMEVIAVADLLDETAAGLSPSGRVAVEVDCRPEVAALGNRDLAAQALATVAANAVKYTREGWIRLSCRSLDGSAVIEVVDSGPGIPEAERELVRRRFYRVGDRDGDRDRFGLGLAIADQAVAAIGGQLEIDAAEGGGTTVRITLPGAELVS